MRKNTTSTLWQKLLHFSIGGAIVTLAFLGTMSAFPKNEHVSSVVVTSDYRQTLKAAIPDVEEVKEPIRTDPPVSEIIVQSQTPTTDISQKISDCKAKDFEYRARLVNRYMDEWLAMAEDEREVYQNKYGQDALFFYKLEIQTEYRAWKSSSDCASQLY